MKTGENEVEWLRGCNACNLMEKRKESLGLRKKKGNLFSISTFHLMENERRGWMYNLGFEVPNFHEQGFGLALSGEEVA